MCDVSCAGYLLIDVGNLISYDFLANFPALIHLDNGKPPALTVELIG